MLEGERITPGQDQPAVERRYQIREPMAGEVHDIGPPQRRAHLSNGRGGTFEDLRRTGERSGRRAGLRLR